MNFVQFALVIFLFGVSNENSGDIEELTKHVCQ